MVLTSGLRHESVVCPIIRDWGTVIDAFWESAKPPLESTCLPDGMVAMIRHQSTDDFDGGTIEAFISDLSARVTTHAQATEAMFPDVICAVALKY